MENQPIDQMNMAGAPAPAPVPAPAASHTMTYTIVILVVVALAVGAWYVFANAPAAQVPSAVVEQAALPPLTGGNTPSDIANDLNQIPNDSAALTQDQNTLGQSIQNL